MPIRGLLGGQLDRCGLGQMEGRRIEPREAGPTVLQLVVVDIRRVGVRVDARSGGPGRITDEEFRAESAAACSANALPGSCRTASRRRRGHRAADRCSCPRRHQLPRSRRKTKMAVGSKARTAAAAPRPSGAAVSSAAHAKECPGSSGPQVAPASRPATRAPPLAGRGQAPPGCRRQGSAWWGRAAARPRAEGSRHPARRRRAGGRRARQDAGAHRASSLPTRARRCRARR